MKSLATRVTFAAALCLLFSLLLAGQSPTHPTKPHALSANKIENAAALANFFSALKATRAGERLEPVRIMHFGDSHIAADILSAQIRRKFQEDFGDGGAGFIVPRNPMSTRRRGVSSGASAGWVIEGIGGRVAADGIYGPAGIALGTSLANERMWLQTLASHFEIYYVSQPGGASIDILVDGSSVLEAPLSLDARLPRVDWFSYDEPVAANYKIEVRTVTSGRARVLGIVGERLNPGITYDVFGINGARAKRLLGWNAAAFARVLGHRKPDLIILSFGTNEAGDLGWRLFDYQQLLVGLLRRLHNAVPQASILIYGPPERDDIALAGSNMPLLIKAQRRAAFQGKAAFWSSYDAMGGRGSMKAWIARGLGQADRVHLTTAGYLRMGDLFYEDLMRAYESNQ